MQKRLYYLIIFLFMVFFAHVPYSAAQTPMVISLAVPSYLQSLFSSSVIDSFQAAYPDIQLHVIPLTIKFSDPVDDIQGYLDNLKTLASSGDVVLVDSRYFMPQATRAQNYLNLKPFTDADASLNPNDFYPAIWQSFQWDGGVWAIPFSANVGVLTYDPAAFDQAALAYPKPTWTLDDLAHAAQALSQKAADGTPLAGLDTSSTYFQNALFRSLLTDNLFDASSVPNQPQFDRPDVAELLSTWADLVKNGAVSVGTSNAPMNIADPQLLNNDSKLAGTLLPGGHAALDTLGLAISAGSSHPDQAYTVASYFATIPGMTLGTTGIPAHKSLFTQSNPNDPVQTLIRQAIDNALSAADTRYTDYLSIALHKIAVDNTDPQGAAQAAQIALSQDLQSAVSSANPQALTVPTPVPVAAGQSISFFASFLRPGYGYDPVLWKQLTDEFTSHDPEIKQINLIDYQEAAGIVAPGDCGLLPNTNWADYFMPMNWLSLINLDLKPLMAADADFNANDFIGDSFQRMQAGDKVFGYPIAISPAYLKYDPAQFKQAGVPEPTDNWTVNDFIEALKQLKGNSPTPPFEQSYTRNFGTQSGALHLLMLMAAFGSSPIDFSTQPVSIKTDPATLDSVQQVLDLAKNGYIKYYANSLGYLDQSLWYTLSKNTDRPAVTTEIISPFTTRKILTAPGQTNPYHEIFYPQGTHVRPFGYDVISAFISAKAPYPDGCYRWIKFIAAHPELIHAMPASRTALDNPNLAAVQGSDLVAFYKKVDTFLQSPNVVFVPVSFQTSGSLYADYWVGQAFNAYVLGSQDLKTGLDQAQQYMQAYASQCEKLPFPADQPSSTDDINSRTDRYFSALTHCTWQIDPSLRKLG